MIKVLLCGPVLGNFKNAYGGGVGGFTRKMSFYLNKFENDQFKFVPFFHTIRGQYRLGFLPVRLLIDTVGLMLSIAKNKPAIVHILGHYHTAIYREAAWIWVCRRFSVPALYEIKAGTFIVRYQEANAINKKIIRYIIKNSAYLLGQGKVYTDFMKTEFGHQHIQYHPNFVENSSKERQQTPLLNDQVKVLFVGYQYKDKGIFELVEACMVYGAKQPIQLTFVGNEHPDFTQFLDTLDYGQTPGFSINRKGVLSYEEAQEEYFLNDVYCYPSRHKGEGHNNSVTEAMFAGMVVASTKIGFVPDFLDEDNGYYIQEVSKNAIVEVLTEICDNREDAKKRAVKARETILNGYTVAATKERLIQVYKSILLNK